MISLGFDPGTYPAGTHMCLIFNDDEERRRVIAEFVRSGLEGHEQVRYYVDSMTPEELKKSLRASGVNLPDELDGRQYSFVEANKAYCPDGRFDVHRLLDNSGKAVHQCAEEGYAGVRFTGEMSWARKGISGSEGLIEFECLVNTPEHKRAAPITAICQYDARLFDGATLYGILQVHPMMIVHGQVVRNPYYVEPEVFLASRGMTGAASASGFQRGSV
jgi:hypothetical protein